MKHSYFGIDKHECVAEVATMIGAPLTYREQTLVKLAYLATIKSLKPVSLKCQVVDIAANNTFKQPKF